MPKVTVVFFKDKDGSVPYKTWIDTQVIRRDRRTAINILQLKSYTSCTEL